ncbi:hypothetical protein CCMSSC00406_0008962 [Pleurotus cornucopiae]|uniref:Uncharacterized protein n=1 Tax=Pleurotus cornucopiae TaxID=5321 RepID=A0ACB7J9R0_PLECO|nr:hypothetical protein CCMSSC00406_0008962 [Pleurotus cornucopiae]
MSEQPPPTPPVENAPSEARVTDTDEPPPHNEEPSSAPEPSPDGGDVDEDKGKGVASTAPEEDKPFTRNWAQGARLEFLNEWLPRYQAAVKERRSKATELINTILNSYFRRFDWRMPVTEEPGPDDKAPSTLEPVTPEERARKGKAITNWMNYRANKVDHKKKHLVSTDDKDPYAVLLSKLSGVPIKPPKRLSGWQALQKWGHEAHEADFNAQLASTGTAPGKALALRNKFYEDTFKALLPPQQKLWIDRAAEAHKEAKEAIKQRAARIEAFSPAERQEALDRIGRFIYPILDGVSSLLGMHTSFFIGGPEPVQGGQVNVISLHTGHNLEASPQTWADANAVAFRRVTKCFQDYLETCYTQDDKDRAAIPGTVPGAAVPRASNIDPGPAAHKHAIPKGRHKRAKGGIESKVPTKRQRRRQSSSEESSSNNSTDSDDSHESVPTKAQRSRADDPRPGDLAYARRRAIQNKQEESRNRAKKHVDLRRQALLAKKAALEEAAEDDDDVSDEEVTFPITRIGPPGPRKRAPPPPSVVSSSNPTSDGNPTSDDVTPVDGNAHETTSEAERLAAGNAEKRDDKPASEDVERSTAITIESQTDTDIQNPSDRSSVPESSLTQGESSQPQPQPLPTPVGPEWFSKHMSKFVKLHKMPSEWTRVLKTFIELESQSSFANPSGPGTSLTTEHRPPQLAWWIGRARGPDPVIASEDRDTFGEAWWKWWKGLQPSWRSVDEEIELQNRHRNYHPAICHAPNAWRGLDKPGQNGFLSIVASLGWWGQAFVNAYPDDEDWVMVDDDAPTWLFAAIDVTWVMQCIMASRESVNT